MTIINLWRFGKKLKLQVQHLNHRFRMFNSLFDKNKMFGSSVSAGFIRRAIHRHAFRHDPVSKLHGFRVVQITENPVRSVGDAALAGRQLRRDAVEVCRREIRGDQTFLIHILQRLQHFLHLGLHIAEYQISVLILHPDIAVHAVGLENTSQIANGNILQITARRHADGVLSAKPCFLEGSGSIQKLVQRLGNRQSQLIQPILSDIQKFQIVGRSPRMRQAHDPSVLRHIAHTDTAVGFHCSLVGIGSIVLIILRHVLHIAALQKLRVNAFRNYCHIRNIPGCNGNIPLRGVIVIRRCPDIIQIDPQLVFICPRPYIIIQGCITVLAGIEYKVGAAARYGKGDLILIFSKRIIRLFRPFCRRGFPRRFFRPRRRILCFRCGLRPCIRLRGLSAACQ